MRAYEFKVSPYHVHLILYNVWLDSVAVKGDVVVNLLTDKTACDVNPEEMTILVDPAPYLLNVAVCVHIGYQ